MKIGPICVKAAMQPGYNVRDATLKETMTCFMFTRRPLPSLLVPDVFCFCMVPSMLCLCLYWPQTCFVCLYWSQTCFASVCTDPKHVLPLSVLIPNVFRFCNGPDNFVSLSVVVLNTFRVSVLLSNMFYLFLYCF